MGKRKKTTRAKAEITFKWGSGELAKESENALIEGWNPGLKVLTYELSPDSKPPTDELFLPDGAKATLQYRAFKPTVDVEVPFKGGSSVRISFPVEEPKSRVISTLSTDATDEEIEEEFARLSEEYPNNRAIVQRKGEEREQLWISDEFCEFTSEFPNEWEILKREKKVEIWGKENIEKIKKIFDIQNPSVERKHPSEIARQVYNYEGAKLSDFKRRRGIRLSFAWTYYRWFMTRENTRKVIERFLNELRNGPDTNEFGIIIPMPKDEWESIYIPWEDDEIMGEITGGTNGTYEFAPHFETWFDKSDDPHDFECGQIRVFSSAKYNDELHAVEFEYSDAFADFVLEYPSAVEYLLLSGVEVEFTSEGNIKSLLGMIEHGRKGLDRA